MFLRFPFIYEGRKIDKGSMKNITTTMGHALRAHPLALGVLAFAAAISAGLVRLLAMLETLQ
jgi:hypothetical protein